MCVTLAAATADEIVFEIRVAFERRERREGARPRLVCRTTPVALITRRSEGREEEFDVFHDARLDGGGIWCGGEIARVRRDRG